MSNERFYEGLIKDQNQPVNNNRVTIVKKTRKYTIVAQLVTEATRIQASGQGTECAEITFYNGGQLPLTALSNAFVLGIPLPPGVSLEINGNEDEEDMTRWDVTFDNAGVNALYVIRKLYTS